MSRKITKVSLEQFEKFYNALQGIDRMNFEALVFLPGAVEKMPEGHYKSMALFARTVLKVLEESNDNTPPS